MLKKKKKTETGPNLTKEEMEELVDKNMQIALKYAKAGNVSGMEMSLEVALQNAQKIGKSFDSREIGRIKLEGFERGEEALRKRALELKEAGKMNEAQKAAALAVTYGNEAKLIKFSLS